MADPAAILLFGRPLAGEIFDLRYSFVAVVLVVAVDFVAAAAAVYCGSWHGLWRCGGGERF